MKRIVTTFLAIFLALSDLMAAGPLLKSVQQPTIIPPTRTNWSIGPYKVYQDITNILKGDVYTDLQCAKTLPADEGAVRAIFATGGSNRLVYAVYGGACNFFVSKLYLADSQGNVLDVKEVEVTGVEAIVLKSFVIEGGVIKVYSIKPASTQSLAFADFGQKFTSFTGIRCDEEYVVDGSRFKLKKRTTYRPTTYTHRQMYAEGKYTFNIWDGTETVSKVQTF